MKTTFEEIQYLVRIAKQYFCTEDVVVVSDQNDEIDKLQTIGSVRIQSFPLPDYYNRSVDVYNGPITFNLCKINNEFEIFVCNVRNYHEYYEFLIIPKSCYMQYKRFIRNASNTPKMILSDLHRTEILNPIKTLMSNSYVLNKYGCTTKIGLLLTGKPGNGKSMIVSYLQNMRWFRRSNSLFTGNFLSQSGLNYEMNKKLLIFDDIDVNLFNRESGPEVGRFLSLLDGVNKHKQQVRIFTTNMPVDNIDVAFLRPGRIDRIIKFDLPSVELREKFIRSWHKDFLDNLQLDRVVKDTEGWSFAQIDAIRTNMATENLFSGKWDYDLAKSKVLVHEEETGIGFQV